MFSLIVVIISIALVAALAIATAYYGGSTYVNSALETKIIQKRTEGEQVVSAFEMFRAAHLKNPTNLQELIDNGFLSKPPESASWGIAGGMIYSVMGDDQRACLEYNRRVGEVNEATGDPIIRSCAAVEASAGGEKIEVCCDATP